MTSTINASTSSGIVQTADTSGVLAIQANGTTGMTFGPGAAVATSTPINTPGVSLAFKNRIINGGMTIDQRNAGASGTNVGYTVDRWILNSNLSTKGTWQQNAGSVTPPAGFTNYLGFTSNSAYSVGSGDYFAFYQPIEGLNISDLAWGTANAKTITVSFWVRSSLTGTFGGAINNSGSSRSYPFTYTISSANTWEQKSVTIAGDTSGTWLTTNGFGLGLSLAFGVGSTYSGTAGSWASANYVSATGATSVVGTNGATFYITGVQLEVGTAATSFEFRDYGRELIMCQRYYWKNEQGIGYAWPLACTGNTNYRILSYSFAVNMRTSPTITIVAKGGNVTPNPDGTSVGVDRVNFQWNSIGGADFTTISSLNASAEL